MDVVAPFAYLLTVDIGVKDASAATITVVMMVGAAHDRHHYSTLQDILISKQTDSTYA
jgi:hypothetical protein